MVVSSQVTPAIDTSAIKEKVEDLAQTLQARGAKDGAKRLKVIAKQIQHFTVEGAFQYLRRDEIVEELENQPHQLLSVLRFLRNVLSIAPIVLTWFALGLAATAYQSDLADTLHYPDDRYQPFLGLWQNGFHGNHGPVISFSSAAGWDTFLLTSLVILVAIIPIGEWWHRNKLHTSLDNFDAVVDDLLDLISKDGANSHLADSDVNKITQGIEGALQRVMISYKQVAVETSELVKDTHQKTQDLIQKFNTDLGIFNSDVTVLAGGLHKLDNNLDNYGQKLTELTDASGKLAGSSNDLALNAKSMADSASQNSQASQGISAQLGALNAAQLEIVKTQQQVADTISQSQKQVAATISQSQQQMATTITQTQGDVVKQFATTQQSVVQEIEQAQKSVVKEISGIADDMEESTKNTLDVAKKLEDVIRNLQQMTQADFQAMTNKVSSAADQMDRVVASLGRVDAQLQNTTQALATTSKSLASTTGKPRSSLMDKIVYSSVFAAVIAVIIEMAAIIIRNR